jgi:cell division septation protein DedD
MGMTLRLRYYDKQRFSADRGDINYAIVGDKFIVTKDSKVVSQDKISVIQPLAGSTETKSPSKTEQPTITTKVTKKSIPAKPSKLRSTPAKKKTVTPKQEK